jgi:hypothetical protein
MAGYSSLQLRVLWMGVLVQLSAGPEFKAFVGAPAATIVAHAWGTVMMVLMCVPAWIR